MSGQQPIMTGVLNLLTANTAVTATVATRIYDTMPPQDDPMPMIVLTVVSDPPQIYFAGDDLGPLEMQVDIYGKVEGGILNTRAIGDTVFATLHRQTFTASGYTGLSILCRDRGDRMDQEMIVAGRSQQDAWRQTQSYRIYGTGT